MKSFSFSFKFFIEMKHAALVFVCLISLGLFNCFDVEAGHLPSETFSTDVEMIIHLSEDVFVYNVPNHKRTKEQY
jgi:hypothetical protein